MCCENNNKDEDNSPKTLNDYNQRGIFKKCLVQLEIPLIIF